MKAESSCEGRRDKVSEERRETTEETRASTEGVDRGGAEVEARREIRGDESGEKSLGAGARSLREERETRLFKNLEDMAANASLEAFLGKITKALLQQEKETGGNHRNHGELAALWKLQFAEAFLRQGNQPRPSTSASCASASVCASSLSLSSEIVLVTPHPHETLASVFLADLRFQRRLLAVVASRWRRILRAWLVGLHDLKRGEGHPPEMTDFERYLTFVFLPHLRRVASQSLQVFDRFRGNFPHPSEELRATRQREHDSERPESTCPQPEASSRDSAAVTVASGSSLSASSLRGGHAGVAARGTDRERRDWVLAVSLLEELKNIVLLLCDLAQRRVLLHFAPVVMNAIHVEMQVRRALLSSPASSPSPDLPSPACASPRSSSSFSSPASSTSFSSSAASSPGSGPSLTCWVAPRCPGVAQAVRTAREEFLASPAGRRASSEGLARKENGGKVLDSFPDEAPATAPAAQCQLLPEQGDAGNKEGREEPRRGDENETQMSPEDSTGWPSPTRWATCLQVEILRGFGRMGLYSEKLLHVVSDESKHLWPHDIVFFLFECGRYGLAVQHLIDKHANEVTACVDKISDPLLYLATAAMHRSSVSHRVFFDAALPRLSAAVDTYDDPAFLRTMISLCRTLDPHLELAPYRALVSQTAVAMRRFVPKLDVNASGLILGLIGNRTARTPRAFRELSRALCMRLETLQHLYAIRQAQREAEESARMLNETRTETAGVAKGRGEEPRREQARPNIFTTVASALTLGDIITSLSSFGLRTHLYPLLEEAVCKTLEGILFARKEALWFLIWISFASSPNFTPKKLTLALREKMADDNNCEVQNGLTEISHTVQKLGAFHAQRLLLPLQLMRVYDPEITRICIDTSLSRDRSSFKRLDSSLSLVFPLAYANALRPEFATEALSAWDINSAKVFVHGNAFRGEYGRATMLAMLWSAAVANLHVQQVHVTSYLDKLFWCIDVPPPALDSWDAFRFSHLPATGYLASFVSLFNPLSRQVRVAASGCSASPSVGLGVSRATAPISSLPASSVGHAPSSAALELAGRQDEEEEPVESFSPPSFKEWHALDDIRQHDRLAIFQIREPLFLLHQIAATYLADAPHAVRRSSKFPLVRAWANTAVDPRVDADRAISAIVQELQGLLLSAGIRSRAFVPCSPEDDVTRPRSSAEKARDTVAPWIGARDASVPRAFSSLSETDDALLACSAKTRTPQCVHLEFLDGRRPDETAWGRRTFMEPREKQRFGLLVLGENDGLKTLPSWQTTHFDTGVNLLRLRALKRRGWQVVTVNVHEWSEAQTPDSRLSLLLDKCEAAGISLPFCVE
ncbi:conserved hypothetical protein [Neospora caninum Liverpool]|nr:conserved hypothetical protein [Neospora caninum Liverpool]CBZ53239.1 conserved hypothetical protein [Neospora caninum Liverpool]|eukprot:XP_003883271.1 conserved hypothetical protein [Neospora caninum Liverpool]